MMPAAACLWALYAPVVHVECGGELVIARAARTAQGLACELPRGARVLEAARRSGLARVLVPVGADGPERAWREQPCRATVMDDTTILLEPISAPIEVRERVGALPRT